ncbi:MAG: carboxypeptidase regulatory-like domain-containing protein [Acidobacteriaceae bacterium]|nr:carboxypeptidase regulatory-like domain-containing protein [Acidobacteriaceae bacterium]
MHMGIRFFSASGKRVRCRTIGGLGAIASTLIAVLMLLLPAHTLNAQEQGRISGLVTDASGSVIPDAKITITNQDKGFTRDVVTNQSGNYDVPSLIIGKYTVEISAPGFAPYKQTNIAVNVNDNIRVDASLQIGGVQQTVEVQANAVQVQAEDATVGQVVNSTQVEALSVNGRNFTSLASLVPGASSTQPSLNTPVGVTSNTNISFNGMRQANNVWRMDGQENYDRGCGGCVTVLPSVEAISEFKVETASASASNGFGNAGQVNVATKSGTRDFHATAWEYIRNDVFDAKNFFTNLNGQPKPPLRFNIYGWNLSGPVFIPKLYPRSKSHTYFFFNEEWRKLRQSSIFNVPTMSAAERTGNFSQLLPKTQLHYPGTTTPIPGNIIPSNMLDPNALILAVPNFTLPLPTNPNGNFTQSYSVPTDLREEIVRIDHSFSDKEQAFFRYIQESNSQNFTNNLWSSSSYPTTTTLLVNKPKLYYGQLTSMLSPTMVNTASLGYLDQPLNLTLNGNYQRPANLNIPLIYPGANFANKNPNLLFTQTNVNYDLASWPWKNELESWTIQDNLTITRGTHTFIVGGMWMHFNKQQDLFGPIQGAFTFDGSATGNDFADFMMGKAFQFQQLQQQTEPNYLSRSGALWVTDSWKASPKLTLNLGLRWDAFPHAYTEQNDVSSFYLNLYNPSQAPQVDSAGHIIPGTGNLLNGIGIAGKNGIPRGLVENHWAIFEPRVGIAWRPFNDDTVIRTGFGIYYERVQGNDIYNAAPNPPFSSLATIFNTSLSNPGGGTNTLIPPSLQGYDPAYPTASTFQYNFGIQRRLASSVVADVSYVGTKGTHLSDNRNLNQPFPQQAALVRAGVLNVNQARPYLGYANILEYYNGGNSNYNSLQASLRTDQWHGLTLQASYTYSHAIDDANNDVPGNAHEDAYRAYLERGNSQFDRTHILVLSYVYNIPAISQQRVAKAVFGNWQLSGISVFETGTPLNITLSGDPVGIGSAPYRPNLVGDWRTGGGSQTIWFNPAAFAQPTPGNFGNAGRNVVRSAGTINTDASLFRNFPGILKRDTSGLQFRAEFYNIFNHTNFSTFGTTFGSPTFGQATAARDARSIQLALRLFY